MTPYLNEVGAVRPFELTNRIEEGDVAGALEMLHRLLTVTSPTQPKPMHPLQVLGILAGRYRKLARLDADTVNTVDDAHRVWGGKSSYPAKKALEATRALGTDGFVRAFAELHRADVGIKGATGLPEGAVLEITVARLANLHRGGGRGIASGGRGRSRAEARAAALSRSRPGQSWPDATWLAAFIRREVRRAAWFLCMTPLDAALPRRFCARSARRRPARRPAPRRCAADLIRGLELGPRTGGCGRDAPRSGGCASSDWRCWPRCERSPEDVRGTRET